MPKPVPQPARIAEPARSTALSCFAVVAPGLESLALAEATTLGLPVELSAGGGGIEWQGDIRSLLLANLGLRIASRIIVRVAQFEAKTFAELEKHVRKIAWPRIVPAGSAVRFRVTCKKSRLYHSDAVMQRVADAIVRSLPNTVVEGASGGEEEDDERSGEIAEQLIVIRLFRDRCTVSADSSGALLHRRGYRLATAKAPLRETIAAALVAASGWDGLAPLVDPLCGSGTIPIEAALFARHRAVGASRTFSIEQWPGVSHALSARVRASLSKIALDHAPGPILGSDRDAGAIAAALGNAERADVTGDVVFAVRSLSALQLPGAARGWIVANPPYGVRVGDPDRVRDLWAQLGNVLRERARGWRLAMLSPDPALERQLRLPVHVVAATANGGIPVRLIVGDVPE